MPPARLVVVGSSNTDLVVRARHIPQPGETVLGDDFLMNPGGKGANQAVAAARLGAHVTLIARIGTDLFGDQALRQFKAEGIDTSFVVRDADAPSGVALITVAQDGQNAITVASGANARLCPADLDRARQAIANADLVLTQFETPLVTVAHLIALTRTLGKRLIINPAPAPAEPLPPGFLEGVWMITPNELEAAMLIGHPSGSALVPLTAGPELLRLGVEHAILTLGEIGAWVVSRGEMPWNQPARPVRPVDTTAAGDCFTGALACALAEGRDLATALDFATAAAAISVTRRGAQASMPYRRELA